MRLAWRQRLARSTGAFRGPSQCTARAAARYATNATTSHDSEAHGTATGTTCEWQAKPPSRADGGIPARPHGEPRKPRVSHGLWGRLASECFLRKVVSV